MRTHGQALRRNPKVQAQVRILWDTAETKVFRMGRDEVLLYLYTTPRSLSQLDVRSRSLLSPLRDLFTPVT